ncbi:MAG: hypothetical protein CL823_06195 [Crocinitomicaceae bacterium]|nr:hypothetical protein [Crocinitomicaceae bacterium]|tara:strand:+ start:1260 stop:2318 length:1059 start_codon:yes stop_codon:yes gene_type:complete
MSVRNLSLTFICLVLAGCWSQEGARAPLPGTVGPMGEVLVVCELPVWNGQAGDSLRVALQKPYPVLPQMHLETYEPMFDLVHKTPPEFNKFWKPHRNIVFLEIADTEKTRTPSLEIYKQRYAMGQAYIEGKARTSQELAVLISERAHEMESYIHKREVERSAGISGLTTDEVIERNLLEITGVSMSVPRGFQQVMISEEFSWLDRQQTRFKGSDNHDVQQALFIHSESYTGPEQFSLEYLLNRRDRLTKKFINGPTDGSYMAIERHMIPTYEEIAFNGEIAAEVKGLWRMENDFMGGPFYSLTMYDKENARLVTVEGYTYAPYFDKRAYMREIEGIVKTAVLLNNKALAGDR